MVKWFFKCNSIDDAVDNTSFILMSVAVIMVFIAVVHHNSIVCYFAGCIEVISLVLYSIYLRNSDKFCLSIILSFGMALLIILTFISASYPNNTVLIIITGLIGLTLIITRLFSLYLSNDAASEVILN